MENTKRTENNVGGEIDDDNETTLLLINPWLGH